MRIQLPKSIALFTILAGIAVMFAWWLDVPFLKSVITGFATMKFTTALCFVCAGVILFFTARHFAEPTDEKETIILLACLIIFILMGTMLIGMLLNIKISLGDLFVREIDVAAGSIPGRPSLGTMISFFLIALGGVIAVRDPKKHQAKLISIGLVLGAVGLVALLGYLFQFDSFYWNFSNFSNAMAIHTAFLFLLLGIGFVALPQAKDPKETTHYLSTIEAFKWSLVVFTILPVIFTAMLSVSSLRIWISKNAVGHLEAVSHIQEKRINEVIRQYKVMAEGISSRILLRQELDLLNTTDNLNAHNIKIQTVLNAALEPLDEIKEVALFDDNDKLLLITPQKDEYDEYKSFVKEYKGRNFVVVKTRNEYSLYLLEPLKYEGKMIGTLVLNFGPQLFESIAEDYIGLGETGEMLLAFQNEDGDVEFLTKVRDPGQRRIIKSTEKEIPVVQALVYKQNATFESSADYRGVPVVAVTKYLEDLGWGFVVKMDKEEIFAGVKDTKNTVGIIAFIVIFFSIITAHFISEKFK